MRLRLLREDAGKVVNKIVVPGDWPSRAGTIIPGSVLPLETVGSDIWVQSKFTQDVMEDSVQMMQYLVHIPQRYLDNPDQVVNTREGRQKVIERGSREWVVNVPCEYEFTNVINRPWDPEETEPLPRSLGIVQRERIELNWVVSLEHDLAKQIEVLSGWTFDDIDKLSVSPKQVSYYSDQQQDLVRYPIAIFK